MSKLTWRQKEIYTVLYQARELWRAGFVVLDFETTGLEEHDEIIQWAICSMVGTVQEKGFIKPTVPISPGAQEVHGISAEQLATAPTFAQAWPTIKKLLTRAKTVVAYNANFETAMLWRSAQPYAQEHQINIYTDLLKHTKFVCAMEMYAQYYGEWHEYFGSYTWQKISTAIADLKIEIDGNLHHAATDAAATAALIQKLAEMAERDLPEGWHPPVLLHCAGCGIADKLFDKPPAEWLCENCSLARGIYHKCPGCRYAVVETEDTQELCKHCDAALEQEKMLIMGEWHWCDGPYCTSGIVQSPDLQEWCEHCQRQEKWKRQAEERERERQERIAAERKQAKREASARYRQRRRDEKAENERRAAEGLPPLERPKPPEPEREFNHHGHHMTRGKDQYERPLVTCSRCGQSWRREPQAHCLGRPTFGGWEAKPENWHTVTQLRKMKLQPANERDQDGYVTTMKDTYCIYDISKTVPAQPRPRRKKKASK